MPQYQYVIVGGGMTADAAVKGIRECDPTGTVGLISSETDPPYNRPPLSKGLWKGDSLESIWRGTDAAHADIHLGRTVQSLDRKQKQVTDDLGQTYAYGKLLLATGGRPRQLPFGGDDIIYYRTLQDYKKLRERTEQHQSFGVIGGGFIGSEVAAALAMNQKTVVLYMLEKTVNGDRYPDDMGQFLNDYYRQKGVEIAPQMSVTGIERRGGQYAIQGRSKQDANTREWLVDCVVAGLGIIPNTDPWQSAGLDVDDGLMVNEYLQTNDPDIYSAGDVASVFKPLLGRRMRVEHEDNANSMGRIAGRNMAGAGEKFDYQPYFYSDLFDLGYEAVGDMDASMEKYADWKVPYHEGVIYYLKSGRVRGVILWNVWGKVDAARQIMRESGPFSSSNLKGSI